MHGYVPVRGLPTGGHAAGGRCPHYRVSACIVVIAGAWWWSLSVNALTYLGHRARGRAAALFDHCVAGVQPSSCQMTLLLGCWWSIVMHACIVVMEVVGDMVVVEVVEEPMHLCRPCYMVSGQ